MMKLTVAFLGALAVADAANARGHRHVRRQYGYGNGPVTTPVFTAPANSTANTATVPPAAPTTSTPVAVGTTDVSPELPSSSSSSSTVEVPGVSFPGTGTAPGTAPTATDVATPLPETTLSPVDGNNQTTSGFPTFVPTGVDGNFPTGVPSGVFPTGTGSGSEDVVTLTISSTQIFTVTQCPSSVTDCPARSTSLVTTVVPVGTTVCGKEEASSIIESGLPSTASATPTGAVTDVDAVATPIPSEVVEDQTTVMTQTIGTGENAHETQITITNKVTKTVYVTGVDTAVTPEKTPVAGEGEPTTYVTTDVTSTVGMTLTITEGAPTGTGSPSTGTPSDIPADSEDTPVKPSGGAGEGECAPPVTVTVTAQETVTVTATGSSSGTDVPVNPGEVPSEDTTTLSPEQPTPVAPGQPTGGAPYPTLNGTAPFFPGSSGFLTATRPSGAQPSGGAPGYGAPAPSGSGAVPSGDSPTSGLPTFVLPSATPAGEAPATPSTTSVSPDAPPPAETSAYGGGYGYGSKKRSFFGLF